MIERLGRVGLAQSGNTIFFFLDGRQVGVINDGVHSLPEAVALAEEINKGGLEQNEAPYVEIVPTYDGFYLHTGDKTTRGINSTIRVIGGVDEALRSVKQILCAKKEPRDGYRAEYFGGGDRVDVYGDACRVATFEGEDARRLADLFMSLEDHTRGVPHELSRLYVASSPSLTDGEAKSLHTLLDERRQKGIDTYGVELHAHNGRDVVKDLKEELADAIMYACQWELEKNSPMNSVVDALTKVYHLVCGEAKHE